MFLRSVLLLSSLLVSEAWQPQSSLAGVRGRRLHAGLSDDVARAKDYLMGPASALAASAAAPPAAWGGEFAAEAAFAASLVQSAVALCLEVQAAMAVSKGDDSLGATVSASAAASGVAAVKGDATPVTAADFGIQGFVAEALRVAFPNDRLMGEEDASSLRDDPTLRAQAAAFANRLLAAYAPASSPLSEAGFVVAVDAGVEAPRPGAANGQERVWILDPIDGTKGLITGKQYVVGLALAVDGEAVVSCMGNPGRLSLPGGPQPPVMLAARGAGLRYRQVASVGAPQPEAWLAGPPRGSGSGAVPWQGRQYDYARLAAAAGLPGTSLLDRAMAVGRPPRVAGVDYPPFLLSRPMNRGSPLPFGPTAAPSEVCCGAMVKYFAVAAGDVAGFIQFEPKLKAWDHAAGVLCVSESGGLCVDGAGQPVRFGGREFDVAQGIVCAAAEASAKCRQLLLAAVAASEIE